MAVLFERDGKVNLVDEKNVLVGYDLSQDCCESAGYFFSRSPVDDKEEFECFHEMPPTLDGFTFDKLHRREISSPNLDEGAAVEFRLVNGDKEIFFVIYNIHNGYYGHGFDFVVDGKSDSGCL